MNNLDKIESELKELELELLKSQLAKQSQIEPERYTQLSIEEEEDSLLSNLNKGVDRITKGISEAKEWATRPTHMYNLPSPASVALKPSGWTGGAGRDFRPVQGPIEYEDWMATIGQPSAEEEAIKPTDLGLETALTIAGVGVAAKTGVTGLGLVREALDWELGGALSLKKAAASKLAQIFRSPKAIEAMRPVELYKTIAQEAPELAKTVNEGLIKMASKYGIKGAEKMSSAELDSAIKALKIH